jgi:hypothetical protein
LQVETKVDSTVEEHKRADGGVGIKTWYKWADRRIVSAAEAATGRESQ